MKEFKFTQQRLRPLTSYCYLEQKTYYHDHVTAPSPRIPNKYKHSRLCIFKLLKAATESITKLLTSILRLETLSVCEDKHLQISQKIHTHSIKSNNKTWLEFSLLYLGQNIKPYTSNGLGLSWKFSKKKQFTRLSIDRV